MSLDRVLSKEEARRRYDAALADIKPYFENPQNEKPPLTFLKTFGSGFKTYGLLLPRDDEDDIKIWVASGYERNFLPLPLYRRFDYEACHWRSVTLNRGEGFLHHIVMNSPICKSQEYKVIYDKARILSLHIRLYLYLMEAQVRGKNTETAEALIEEIEDTDFSNETEKVKAMIKLKDVTKLQEYLRFFRKKIKELLEIKKIKKVDALTSSSQSLFFNSAKKSAPIAIPPRISRKFSDSSILSPKNNESLYLPLLISSKFKSRYHLDIENLMREETASAKWYGDNYKRAFVAIHQIELIIRFFNKMLMPCVHIKKDEFAALGQHIVCATMKACKIFEENTEENEDVNAENMIDDFTQEKLPVILAQFFINEKAIRKHQTNYQNLHAIITAKIASLATSEKSPRRLAGP